ncbi:MAG: hypothetical protein ACXVGA_08560 [Mycobacteriaceae bacterium]
MAEQQHPFTLVLDENVIHGHIFGTLSVRTDAGWMPVERRCHLCNRLPIEMLTVAGGAIECAGLHVNPPLATTPTPTERESAEES